MELAGKTSFHKRNFLQAVQRLKSNNSYAQVVSDIRNDDHKFGGQWTYMYMHQLRAYCLHTVLPSMSYSFITFTLTKLQLSL
jgi:hypothetical protein